MARVAMLEKLSEAEDQKSALIEAVGDLKNIQILGTKLLVAIYIEPDFKVLPGGQKLYSTPGQKKESIWQGTVGVVLKKGENAFKDDATNSFNGQTVNVHEWVVFRPGDARRVQIRGVDCRLIEDTLIDLVIDDPELITHK